MKFTIECDEGVTYSLEKKFTEEQPAKWTDYISLFIDLIRVGGLFPYLTGEQIGKYLEEDYD